MNLHEEVNLAKDSNKTNMIYDRVVVLGASVGGIVHAAAIAPYAKEVIVVDRDVAPDLNSCNYEQISRAQTPQDQHLHGLLAGGIDVLDEMFKGRFTQEIRKTGAICLGEENGLSFDFNLEGMWMPYLSDAPELKTWLFFRSSIDLVLRRLVAEMYPNISIRWETTVRSLVLCDADGSIQGVEVAGPNSHYVIPCPLQKSMVIDCMGSGSPIKKLLDLQQSEVESVSSNMNMGYVSVVYKTPAHIRKANPKSTAYGVLPNAARALIPNGPAKHRGGVVAMDCQNGCSMITLTGFHEDRPTSSTIRTMQDVVEFIRGIGEPKALQAIGNGEGIEIVRGPTALFNPRQIIYKVSYMRSNSW